MPVQWLDDGGEERAIGKKGAAVSAAAEAGLDVPRGFVVTAQTFEQFVRENGLEQRIQRILDETDTDNLEQVQEAENRIRALLEERDVDEAVREEIETAYEQINMSEEVRSAAEEAVDLVGGQRETEFVAVRSSPTGARMPGAFHTELNVNGKDAVVAAVKDCWASLYSAEALSMEDHLGEIHSMAVIVQRMQEPDVSGTAYSTHPLRGEGHLIEAVWGLGTGLADGTATPDRFHVDTQGSVTGADIATKEWEMVRDPTSGKSLKQRVSADKRQDRTLDSDQVRDVVETVQTVAGTRGGDVAVAFGIGRNGVTVFDVTPVHTTPAEQREEDGDGVVTGRAGAPGTASGDVATVYSDTALDTVDADVVVASVEAADRLIPVLPQIGGVVADQGGASSNLATVARRLDVPCIVAAGNATDRLASGQTVTIDGAAGTVAEGVEHRAGGSDETAGPAAAGGGEVPLTATHVKVVNSVAPDADGAVIPDRIDPRQAGQVADTYHPGTVWARTRSPAQPRENLGVLRHADDAAPGDGVILDSYGGVMRAADFVDAGVSFLGVDVDALEEDGGREALLNAVEQIGQHSGEVETAVLLDAPDAACIEAAVAHGVDTVAVPEEHVAAARRAVAKAERTFMLERLRDLQ